MASSFLSPPNHYSLSDAVIGGVVQRARPLYSRFGFAGESDSRAAQSYTMPRQTLNVGHEDAYSPDKVASKMTEKYESKRLIGQKRLPDLDSISHVATKRSTSKMQVVAELPPQPVPVRKMRVSASRRERCRVNQARYRKRQRKHAEDLDEGICKVQQEIQDLETQRQKILRRSPTNESVWVVATEYFRLFRYGYMAPLKAVESSVVSPLASCSSNTKKFQRPQSHAQLDFLKSNMASDVTDGSVSGAEALIENWKLLSLYCGDVHVQLKRLEQATADCLLASTTTSFTITENTLQNVFPHLVVDQDNEEVEGSVLKLSPLAKKLLNQRLVLHGSVRFDWEVSTGRVVRLEPKVDLLTPILQLVGSLEDVATVFDKAFVTMEGRFMKVEKAACSESSDASN